MRVAIVGAGAVGLATARELAERGHEVFVLEAAQRPGAGITSRNSEVVHAGLYYAPGSLKARLCVEGRDRLVAYLASKGERVRRLGKLVVAADDAEVPALEALAANAHACGVDAVELLDGAEVRRREPAVRAVAALWSPLTSVCDAHGLVRALRGDVERAGGTVLTSARVVSAEPSGDGYRLTIDRGEDVEALECDAVANAAGLVSDVVARLPFASPPAALPSHRYVKGSYARVRWPRAASLAPPGCLVYPIPAPEPPHLGVHLTIDVAGGLRLGPDAEPLEGRTEDYRVADDVAPRFERAARRFLDLPDGVETAPDSAGIRPIRTDGRDFYVAVDLPRWVNFIGIDSPGLTASLALGRLGADMLGDSLEGSRVWEAGHGGEGATP